MPELSHLERGTPLIYGGNQVVLVPDEIADRFRPGDRLLVVQRTGEPLLVPQAEWAIAESAVARAKAAFQTLNAADDALISRFYEEFAARLEDEAIWQTVSAANAADVEDARHRGRSTTRLVATDGMRRDMVAGLRGWRDTPSTRNAVVETVSHDGWRVDVTKSGYGVVGFVFESRPNVFADATGVLRGGNTTVLRIGRDALGTAKALMEAALHPALHAASLPEDAVTLVDSPEHAAGWALFSQPGLGLAVARGSGRSVALLGGLASQAGIPVSLHGTGGAWIVADDTASPNALKAAVYHSTDRKVCNTLNTLCLPRSRGRELAAVAVEALEERGRRLGHGYRLHVAEGSEALLPHALYQAETKVMRASGNVTEPTADILPIADLGREWEWEQTPEVTLVAVDGADEAVELFNRYSPRFAASLISEDAAAHERFFRAVDAPFVGNGFTRWVDGQYALGKPELGLSNWEYGRLFARAGVLSGDSVFTLRLRVTQDRPDLHR